MCADAYVQAHKQAVFDIILQVFSLHRVIYKLKPLLLEVNTREKYQDYFDVLQTMDLLLVSSIKESVFYHTL